MQQWKKNLYTAWITQIFSITGFGFVLPFLPYYIQELGVNDPDELRYWVGLISSAPSLFLGAMAPVWGFLADRLGRKLMMMRAMLGGSVLIVFMGVAQSAQMVFVFRAIQGLFAGTITASATLVAAGTPTKRLSYALGFLSSSTFIGMSMGPLVGGLLAEFIGFRLTFFAGAAIILVGFFLVLIFIQDVQSESPKPKDGKSQGVERQRPFIFNIIRQPFLFIFLMVFLMRFCRMLPMPFLPVYVQELRGTIKGASAITGLISSGIGAATALAGFTLARLGDRYNKRVLLGLFLAISATITLPIFFVGGLLAASLFLILGAFFFGGIEPTLQSYMSSQTPPGSRGMIFGVWTLLGSLGWFFSPITGSAIAVALSTKHIFLFYSIFQFLSVLLILGFQVYRSRNRTGADAKNRV
jgi:DHA1 family multidrug resistance protein-like MFS transporter